MDDNNSLNFDFPEDETFFRELIMNQNEWLNENQFRKLFDFRTPELKRKEFNKIRNKRLNDLVEKYGEVCMINFEGCDLSTGKVVDHIIPLSSNKLNKNLRSLPALRGKKVLTQSFGSNNLDNLIIACAYCNNHKKHRFLEREKLQSILRIKNR